MMIGSSRPKTHIRRNSSMRGLIVVSDTHPQPSSHPQNQNSNMTITDGQHHHYLNNHNYNQLSDESFCDDYNRNFLAMMSLRNRNHHLKRNSGGFDQSNFLKTCGLCRRRLVAGRDLYMYKGDAAFCSEECREEQMKRDGTVN